MNAKTTEQETAVFTPCAESAEATRAFPVLDEDTRELPLIADRFAGRYWDGRMEKETDETGEKPARKKTWRSALAFGARRGRSHAASCRLADRTGGAHGNE